MRIQCVPKRSRSIAKAGAKKVSCTGLDDVAAFREPVEDGLHRCAVRQRLHDRHGLLRVALHAGGKVRGHQRAVGQMDIPMHDMGRATPRLGRVGAVGMAHEHGGGAPNTSA
ncbi:hypothetical protein ruthe_01527 [Rubellimicrobium thermophilum DSM 16684]|uniref:Uncharacterized protein n=1 Tax=Rubellimicrobium thermophilum DSM 16684 TaxID=1123069 RepID=S9SK24_9RHOB|nr:hypothetical protein [Rubellimicrobium thermophilum]EPX86709.1 hypothetical protein ruthe_01527 [Rubellimicrobium thermophilum DSM 16684]